MIHVVEHDCARLRRDPPGEAAADRDADAALDLLLDADGGPRDELVRGLVEEEDRAGVGAEGIADAREQDGEQLVHLEVRERRVRHRLQLLEAPARRALGLEEPRVVDRERGAIGCEFEQLDVAAAEDARHERPDVDDAEDGVPDDERDAEEGLDALLAQDRIEDVGVVDVVEDDGSALGGDAAGEAAPERDADTALHLLLEPDRSARHELLPLLVEEEHRSRVAIEQVADAREQRPEQILEVEMGERRVGEGLQPAQPLRVLHGRGHATILKGRCAGRGGRAVESAGVPAPPAPGFALWFTGLPGAGKSTLARLAATELERKGRLVELLDGDVVRTHLSRDLGFGRADRETNVERIAWVTSRLVRARAAVVVAAIAPYAASRAAARRIVEVHGAFVEVHVATSLEECVRRDPKGLYARAAAGEIANVTGLDDPYEEPASPELRLDTAGVAPDESLALVLAELDRRGLL